MVICSVDQNRDYHTKNWLFAPNIQNFWFPLIREPMRHLFVLKHWPVRLQLAARDKNVQFWPQNLDVRGQKSSLFIWISQFLSTGHTTSIPGAITFPFPKKFCSRAMGHFPGQWNLVGPSRPSKKWPTMTTNLVLAGITEKQPFYVAKKLFFWPNARFFPNNTQNLLKR